jgi:hypothetical protein
MTVRMVTEPCPHCAGSGERTRECCDVYKDLEQIDHSLNAKDIDNPGLSHEGYQVYKCKKCNTLWGCRYQWNAGTGSDNRWAELDQKNPVRHY